MKRTFVLLLGLGIGAATVAMGARLSFEEHAALRESLDHVPRKQRAWWLERHGYDASRYAIYQRPETSGLSLIGKWGRGPSVEVMAQDTLMALTLGSECALLSIANPDEPRVLSEIQLDYLPRQSLLCDTLLFTGGNGIQIWDVANPALPVRLSEIPYAVGDFSVVDTFLYFVGSDTFFSYSTANPSDPRRIGFCVDSGYVTTANRATAFVIRPNDVLGLLDVTNPTSPHQVGVYSGWCLSAAARDDICCITLGNPNQPSWLKFVVLDVRDPALPVPLGSLDSCGAYDIHLADSLAFLSGYYTGGHEFRAVNLADSTHPMPLAQCSTIGQNFGVWSDLATRRAYVADQWNGLVVIDITSLTMPLLDTVVMRADQAEDVWVDGSRVYVADYRTGMKVLDVSDPSRPTELGSRDSSGAISAAVAARDSFAFLGWFPGRQFRTIDVSDPLHPVQAASCSLPSRPADMALKDSLVCGAGRLRFYIINVARPREPVLVGICTTQDGEHFGLAVQDTLAYIAGGPSLQIVNISNPASPHVVGSGGRPSTGVAVMDTFAYIPYAYDTLFVYSIADPARFRLLSAAPAGVWPWDIALGESTAYVGAAYSIDVYDLGNPAQPVLIGGVGVPNGVSRLHYSDGFLYAALWEGGLAVYETTGVGVVERRRTAPLGRARLRAAPNPVRDQLRVFGALEGSRVMVHDAAGRTADVPATRSKGGAIELNMAGLTSGVYFVEIGKSPGTSVLRIVRP